MKNVFCVVRSLLAIFCCFFLAACLEGRLPEGVVATVNGEAIRLRSLQTLLDGRLAPLESMQQPSLENMQRQYGDALGTMILHVLVRQELRDMHMPVTDAEVDAALAAVEQDYGGPDALNGFLAEASLGKAEWLELLRDHLSVMAFGQRVLLPGIKVTLAEIRDWYAAHEKDFQLPEMVDACFATGTTQDVMEDFCRRIATGDWSETQNLSLLCRDMPISDIPQQWRKSLHSLKEGQCATPRRVDGAWQTIALMARSAPSRAGLAEVYVLVENILREQKMRSAFDSWLEEKLKRADIRVSSVLLATVLTPPSARPPLHEDEGNGTGQNAAPTPAQKKFKGLSWLSEKVMIAHVRETKQVNITTTYGIGQTFCGWGNSPCCGRNRWRTP